MDTRSIGLPDGFVLDDVKSDDNGLPAGFVLDEAPQKVSWAKRGQDAVEAIGRGGLGTMKTMAHIIGGTNGETATDIGLKTLLGIEGNPIGSTTQKLDKAFSETIDASRSKQEKDWTGTLTGIGGEVVGNLMSGGGLVGKGVAPASAAATSIGGRIMGNTAIAAAQSYNAPTGVNESKLDNALIGGALGGTLSGAGELAKGVYKVGKEARAAIQTIQKANDDVIGKLNSTELSKTYKELSKAAKDVGGIIRPEATQPLYAQLDDVLNGLKRSDAPKAFEVVDDIKAATQGGVELNAIDDLWKRLNTLINGGTTKMGDMTPDAAILSQVKSSLRQFVDGVDEGASLTANTPEAIKGFAQARKVWQQKLKVDDVRDMFLKSRNPATGNVDAQLLRNEAGKLWRRESAARYTSYSQEELGQIFELFRTGKMSGGFWDVALAKVPTLAKMALTKTGYMDDMLIGRGVKLAEGVAGKSEKLRMDSTLLRMNLEGMAKSGVKQSTINRIAKVVDNPKPDLAAKALEQIARSPEFIENKTVMGQIKALASGVRIAGLQNNEVKRKTLSEKHVASLKRVHQVRKTLGYYPDDLIATLRKKGGIQPSELTAQQKANIGRKNLYKYRNEWHELFSDKNSSYYLRRKNGMSPDMVRETLVDEGFLDKGATIDDAYQLVKKALSGERVYNKKDMIRMAEVGLLKAQQQFDDYDIQDKLYHDYIHKISALPDEEQAAIMEYVVKNKAIPEYLDNLYPELDDMVKVKGDYEGGIGEWLGRELTDPNAQGGKVVMTETGETKALLEQTKSVVLVNKETGEVLGERYLTPSEIGKLNTEKYAAVNTYDYLTAFNRAVKDTGGGQPKDGWAKDYVLGRSKTLSARPEATVAAVGLAGGLGAANIGSGIVNEVNNVDAKRADLRARGMRLNDMEGNTNEGYTSITQPPARGGAEMPSSKPIIAAPESLPVSQGVSPDIVDRIIRVESGGRADAKAKTSSATGLGQFISSTWLAMVEKHTPELMVGRSKGEILNLRKDPELSRYMTQKYVEDNAKILKRAGVKVSDGAIYLAHFLGPQRAAQVLKSDPSTPIGRIVGQKAVQANRSILAGKRVKDVIRWAEGKVSG